MLWTANHKFSALQVHYICAYMFPFHCINGLHIKYHTILFGMLPHISILYLSSCPAGSLALWLNEYCKKYFVSLILKLNLDCKHLTSYISQWHETKELSYYSTFRTIQACLVFQRRFVLSVLFNDSVSCRDCIASIPNKNKYRHYGTIYKNSQP